MIPPPSTPATMPTARMMTRIGMPRRDERELTRMLAATSNAPIRNRLLMVVASKGGTPYKTKVKRKAEK
ncbi:hypothetical protein A245_31363 [Pseudomonas syringae pv. actinidiae ICMP 19096]|uniref:Uncharacterized protein n=1 Tax=Pseudomonas syringae pv. actinidiae ICMP 19096 TaxID=1194405 RepID=A0A656JQX4_PSESF|nr:hypothetical protein A245_31363 [Pseudomonas syringae pv. actinidiae ICMP 19096]